MSEETTTLLLLKEGMYKKRLTVLYLRRELLSKFLNSRLWVDGKTTCPVCSTPHDVSMENIVEEIKKTSKMISETVTLNAENSKKIIKKNPLLF